MKERKSPRKYSIQFKEDAVNLVMSGRGQFPSEMAAEIKQLRKVSRKVWLLVVCGVRVLKHSRTFFLEVNPVYH